MYDHEVLAVTLRWEWEEDLGIVGREIGCKREVALIACDSAPSCLGVSTNVAIRSKEDLMGDCYGKEDTEIKMIVEPNGIRGRWWAQGGFEGTRRFRRSARCMCQMRCCDETR